MVRPASLALLILATLAPAAVSAQEGAGALGSSAPSVSAPAQAEPEAPQAEPEAQPEQAEAPEGAAALPAPAEVSARGARELANLEIQELALERETSQTDLDQAVAVALYVGGVLGAIGAVSLTIGAILEGVCFNGIVEECLDGPSFVAGAIPTAVISATLLAGATLLQRRVDARTGDFRRRGDEIQERRRQLEHDLGVALGWGTLAITGTF